MASMSSSQKQRWRNRCSRSYPQVNTPTDSSDIIQTRKMFGFHFPPSSYETVLHDWLLEAFPQECSSNTQYLVEITQHNPRNLLEAFPQNFLNDFIVFGWSFFVKKIKTQIS